MEDQQVFRSINLSE